MSLPLPVLLSTAASVFANDEMLTENRPLIFPIAWRTSARRVPRVSPPPQWPSFPRLRAWNLSGRDFTDFQYCGGPVLEFAMGRVLTLLFPTAVPARYHCAESRRVAQWTLGWWLGNVWKQAPSYRSICGRGRRPQTSRKEDYVEPRAEGCTPRRLSPFGWLETLEVGWADTHSLLET